jgi:hypothetical protein
VKIF